MKNIIQNCLDKDNAHATKKETISILQTHYQDEVQAFNNYQAYAKKARSEKYPNIAKLFISIATSESIHARNFKNCLTKLGLEAQIFSQLQLKFASTHENLKFANAVELEEIEKKYPDV